MGYAVGDFRTSLGHGDAWIRVPVWCYMECNNSLISTALPKHEVVWYREVKTRLEAAI